ncbi:tetratricopeptide repeat protein 7A [Hordeum vulgare]|nr:tetratricopeptide repeat protein 7A [Hordeum vulgare]
MALSHRQVGPPVGFTLHLPRVPGRDKGGFRRGSPVAQGILRRAPAMLTLGGRCRFLFWRLGVRRSTRLGSAPTMVDGGFGSNGFGLRRLLIESERRHGFEGVQGVQLLCFSVLFKKESLRSEWDGNAYVDAFSESASGRVHIKSEFYFSLLYPEMTDAAEECKTIIDIVESAWLNGVPEGTSKECKMIEMFHSTLPKLWMRSGCFEEAFIAYRIALVRPWNLDSQRSANLQKERAVTLLCCGVDVKFPQEFNRQQNMAVEVLVNHLETLLTGTYSRSEMWYILALFSSATGMDDSALNIIRNGFRVLERKGKPHVPSLLLGAKQTMMSTSHTKKLRLQEEALRLLQEAAAIAKCNPEIMYSLAWENAMQRELNATVENATECLEMVMGGSVIAWKLLNIVLSLHQNFQEAEGVVNIAIDEAEKDDQLDILRLKAQIKASRGQFKRAVESFRVLLATIQAKKEVWKSTTCSEVKSLRKLEMDAWLDLASIYTKLEA